MNWLDILERINQGEDDHTEFKRGLGNLKPVGRAIAAFANTDGGVVVLGVDDTATRRVGYTGSRSPASEVSNRSVAMGAYSCEGGAPAWSRRPLNCRIFTTSSATS